jgi:hypothetical protein
VLIYSNEIHPSYKEIVKRGWTLFQVQELERFEKESIISDYLALFGKSFDALQMQR